MTLFLKKSIPEINHDQAEEIQNFISNHNGLVFHEFHFNKIISECFQTDFFYLLAFSDNNELVALCPIHVKNSGFLKILNTKMPADVPYGGWIYNNKIVLPVELYARLEKISFNEKLVYTSNMFVNEQDYSGKVTKQQSSIIDLSVSENDIWEKSFNSKKRNKIRKSTKAGILIETYQNIEGLELVWPLFETLHKRLNSRYSLPNIYYKNLLNYCFQNKWANILVARKDNQVLAAVILIGNKNVIHYWKGASLYNADNEGQGELLQWEAIKWSKSVGAHFYDLCVINKAALPKIYEFKTSFSNNIVDFFSYSKSSIVFKTINLFQSWLISN